MEFEIGTRLLQAILIMSSAWVLRYGLYLLGILILKSDELEIPQIWRRKDKNEDYVR